MHGKFPIDIGPIYIIFLLRTIYRYLTAARTSIHNWPQFWNMNNLNISIVAITWKSALALEHKFQWISMNELEGLKFNSIACNFSPSRKNIFTQKTLCSLKFLQNRYWGKKNREYFAGHIDQGNWIIKLPPLRAATVITVFPILVWQRFIFWDFLRKFSQHGINYGSSSAHCHQQQSINTMLRSFRIFFS